MDTSDKESVTVSFELDEGISCCCSSSASRCIYIYYIISVDTSGRATSVYARLRGDSI